MPEPIQNYEKDKYFICSDRSSEGKSEAPGRTSSGDISARSPGIAATGKEFEKGDAVKVKRPPGQPGYADATIVSKGRDGTYTVEYSDGQTEIKVKAIRIHKGTDSNETKPEEESKSGM